MDPNHLKTIKARIARGGVCTMCGKSLPDTYVTIVAIVQGEKLSMAMCLPCHSN